MIVRRANLHKANDFIAIVLLFHREISETYAALASANFMEFIKEIDIWKAHNLDVWCAVENNEIIGFLCGYEIRAGFCKPHYYGAHAYVLPMYRKTKAAYLLYHSVVAHADSLSLPIIANGYMDGNANKILSKFGKPLFTTFIRETKE